MLWASFPPRCGAGWKAGLSLLLPCVYLSAVLSKHYISITLCVAVSSTTGSSVGEEAHITRECVETVTSPPLAQCRPHGVQDGVSGASRGLKEALRRYSLSGLLEGMRNRHSFHQSTGLGPARLGSILFVFAALIVGRRGRQGRSVSFRGGLGRVQGYARDTFLTDVGETALVLASLATAACHFRKMVSPPDMLSCGAPEDPIFRARAISFTSVRERRSLGDGVPPLLPGQLQRSVSTDKVSDQTSVLTRRVETAVGADASNIESISRMQKKPARGMACGDQKLLMPRLPARSEVDSRTLPSGGHVLSGFQKRFSGIFLKKHLLPPRPQLPTIPSAADGAPTLPPCGTADESRAWWGVVAAVSKAINKACTRVEPNGSASGVTKDFYMYTTEDSELASARPRGPGIVSRYMELRHSMSTLDGLEVKQIMDKIKRGPSRVLGVKEEESTLASDEKSLHSGSGRQRHPSVGDLTRLRRTSFLPKIQSSMVELTCQRKVVSLPKVLKKHSTSSRDCSDGRPPSSDRECSSSPETQTDVRPTQSAQARRLLPFRKHKKTPEADTWSTESVAQSATTSHDTFEGALQKVLRTENTSTLISTGTRWWEQSKHLLMEEVTERTGSVLSTLDDSTRDSTAAAVKELTSKVANALTADILQLSRTAARWIDWLHRYEICPGSDTTSFLEVRKYRYAFGVSSAEELEHSIPQEFSNLVLKEAEQLQRMFAGSAREMESGIPLSVQRVNSLRQRATRMQALIVIIRAMDMKNHASVAVGKAHAQLLKLFKGTAQAEGELLVSDYCRNVGALAKSDKPLTWIRQATTALKSEIISRVHGRYEDAVLNRLPKSMQLRVVRGAMEEVFSSLVKSSVSESVEADVRGALQLMPDMSLPSIYHLLGHLNDAVVKQRVIDYHISGTERTLPSKFYEYLRVVIPRLAIEYSWLRGIINFGESSFYRDCGNLNARVHVMIALSEELNLAQSVHVEKLRRTVKLAKQLEPGAADLALVYIQNQLTSQASEDAEVVLAGVIPAHKNTVSGHSLEEAVSQSLA